MRSELISIHTTGCYILGSLLLAGTSTKQRSLKDAYAVPQLKRTNRPGIYEMTCSHLTRLPCPSVGVATVAFLMLSKRDPCIGLNAGFIALCLNFAVTGAISLLRPIELSGFEER